MNRFHRTLLTSIAALGFAAGTTVVAFAGEEERATTSRHTFRSLRAGTSDQLVQTRVEVSQAQVVQAQPLRGSEVRTTSTTASARTSDLLSPARIAAPLRSAVAESTPGIATVAQVRQVTPMVVGAAEDDQQQVVDERYAVDNNARLAQGYSSYQPTTVSYESAQLALAAHRVQHVGYGNTYGTYSPASYHGSISYSYAPRTYYRSSYYGSGYYGGRSTVYYNSSPRYYSSSYCAPTYYRPSYSYYAPVYHRPSYRYYSSYSNCYRPSYSFGYSYGKRYGSSWGFSIGW